MNDNVIDTETEIGMACGICWWHYDPAVGDDQWPVAPGTSFKDLPTDWRCPVCDAPLTKFEKARHD